MHEKRSERRVCADSRVRYTINDVVVTGQLLDLSTKGCRLADATGMGEIGDAIEITLLEGLTVPGVVIWAENGVLAVNFDHPVGEVAVRYFDADKPASSENFRPTDRFGRAMPPLSRLSD
jgi:hypothetical protein